MATLLHASRPRTFGIHNLGGRNYDYTEMYSPDKPGEEAAENARVWYVYLDEAGNHDADMIEGFQSIIDSLLVFAALFSAVVTTFVAQTSQALQPDNAQIMVSLLFETNQLLRAAINGTSMNPVPEASLGPDSRTYTSIDVWVNGLFFTSLALSLSTALLSVLAKQWIQAYTATVSGDAKTRAFIRQFRFEGLVKWKFGEIIEILPLILHCSVAIFLIGLALYVSQLSRPICGIVATITAFTFLFYLASSMLPAFYIACPYRIPFMFPLAQLLSFAFRMTRWICLCFCSIFDHKYPRPWRPQWMPRQPLKIVEHAVVLQRVLLDGRLAYNSLDWVFNNSSNRFVTEIVIEGTCGLLDKFKGQNHLLRGYLNPNQGNIYLLPAIVYSLSRLPDTYPAFSMEDEIGNNKYGRLIKNVMKVLYLNTLLDEPTAGFEDWQDRIRDALLGASNAALLGRNHVLYRWLLDLGGPNLCQSGGEWSREFLFSCAKDGDTEDFRRLVQRGVDLSSRDDLGATALHHAAFAANLDMVIALVEQEPALISAQESILWDTVIDSAISSAYFPGDNGSSDDSRMMVITYLLDHGAQFLHHYATTYNAFSQDPRQVKLLLDCGWDRTVKDAEGKTLLEVVRRRGNDTLVEYLEHYQTVRLAPYGMTSHIVKEEKP